MKTECVQWPEVLAACSRMLSESVTSCGSERADQGCLRPEAAFRASFQRGTAGVTELKNIVGGIPKILSCTLHSVAPRIPGSSIAPEPNEQPVGVIMRRPRREDLYVFYRACDTSLVLYTLPEESQSQVMLVPLETDAAIREATLGGSVSRIEFFGLQPSSYLVVSFSLVDLDALQRQALLLREQGMCAKALVLLEEVLELDPENCLAWTRKGYLLRAMGLAKKGVAAVEKALKINPKCALAWRAKGALLRDDGHSQEGLDCYLRSLELDPTDHLCWQNKGNALLALARGDEAQEAYAKAREVQVLYPEEKH